MRDHERDNRLDSVGDGKLHDSTGPCRVFKGNLLLVQQCNPLTFNSKGKRFIGTAAIKIAHRRRGGRGGFIQRRWRSGATKYRMKRGRASRFFIEVR